MTRIRFEDLPSTNTPRNAENLNKLNNVVISSTEPTTGEEVWVQKSKNKFNAYKIVFGNQERASYEILGVNKISVTNQGSWAKIYTTIYGLEPNKEYTISADVNNSEMTPCGLWIDDNNNNIINTTTSAKSALKTTSSLTGTIALQFYSNWSGNSKSDKVIYDNIQVEKGSKVTDYEMYVDKKIYAKNDNDIYDEILNVESVDNQRNYSTEEQRIGTWIDGKPLYRKTILLENVELPANGDGTIYELTLMDLSNIDHIDLSKFHVKAGVDSSSIYTTTIIQNTYFGDDNYFYVRGFTNNLLIQTNYWKYIHKGCITLEYTKTTA